MNKSEPTGEVIERRNYMSNYTRGIGTRVSYGRYRGGMPERATFKTLTEVDSLLNKLNESIKLNGHATVAEYYKLTGGEIMTDDTKAGWSSFMGLHINKTRYGYELSIPYPEYLDIDPIAEAYDILSNADEDNYGDAVLDAMEHLRKSL